MRFRIFLITCLLACAVVTSLTQVATAQIEGFTGPGRYRIESVASGKALDVKLEDKRTVQQWASSSAANQQWDVEDARDGFFYLRSVEANKVMDFAENRVRDGITLIVADRRDSDNQKWKIADTGNKQFTLVSKSGKAADIPATRRNEDGVPLQTQGLHGLENQRFRFFRLGDLPAAAGRPRERGLVVATSVDPKLRYTGPGRYAIQFVHSGKNLDLELSTQERVHQWTTHLQRNQQWDIEDAGGGWVYLRSAENGKALEVMERRPIDGTVVNAKPWRNADEQKWRINDLGNSEFNIVSKLGRAIDMHGFSKDDGVAIQVWQDNRAENQRFRFTRLEVTLSPSGRIRGGGTPPAPVQPAPPPQPVEEEYTPGSVIWRGRVNREILLDLRQGQFTERTVIGQSFNNGRILKSSGRMPLRVLDVRIRNIKKVKGSVEIAEQPSAANNFTAVIRIRNNEKDSADYEFEVSW